MMQDKKNKIKLMKINKTWKTDHPDKKIHPITNLKWIITKIKEKNLRLIRIVNYLFLITLMS